MKKETTLKVLIGICGSIAAYKVLELIRKLRNHNFEVKCILSQSAQKFITPLTVQTLSNNRVYTDMFELDFSDPQHISLSEWPDIIIIAPATANTISKLACGLADELLTSVILATAATVLICPAMNSRMWQNPILQDNVNRLKKLGYKFLGPEKGDLVCGGKGIGRLISVDKILTRIMQIKQHSKGNHPDVTHS